MRTPEVATTIVDQAYSTLVGQAPPPAEAARIESVMRRGGDVRRVEALVVGGEDFYRARGGGTDAGFVAALYADFLGRTPSATEQADWVRRLERGASRTAVAQGVVMSPEAIALQAEATLASMGGSGLDSARLTRTLRRPAGMDQALAETYGSDAVYQAAIAPAASAVPAAPGATATANAQADPPGLPLAPTLSLGTSWTPAETQGGPTINGGNLMSAAPDGSIWVAGGPGDPWPLYVYSPEALPRPTWIGFDPEVGPIISLSAVSATEALVIGLYEGQEQLWAIFTDGAVSLLNIPNGVTPSRIAAAPDETWLLYGTDQSVWVKYPDQASFKDTQPVPSPGPQFTPTGQFSVGSQQSIWGLFQEGGTRVPLELISGAWQPAPGFPTTAAVTGLSAASDGSVWAVAGQKVYLLPPGGTWAQVTDQTPPAQFIADAVSANSQYRMAALMSNDTLEILSVGVADQQGQPWPSMDAGEQIGYQAITVATQSTDSPGGGGIRGEYINLNFATSSAEGIINNLPEPAGITNPTDWTDIKSQIIDELDYVSTVRNLFSNLSDLEKTLKSDSKTALNTAYTNVSMGNSTGGTGTVTLLVEGLADAALWGIAAGGISDGFSVAASVIASAFGTATSLATNNPNPNNNTKLTTTYQGLLGQIDAIYDNTANLDTGYYDAIVTNWGRLQVASTMANGPWAWDPTMPGTAYANAMAADSLYDYQTLMPAKWEAVQYVGYPICFWNQWYECQQPTPPGYDLLTTPNPKYNNNRATYQFLVQLGNSTDLYSTGGPFPSQILLNAIYDLGVGQSTLFSAQGGWDMQVITVTY